MEKNSNTIRSNNISFDTSSMLMLRNLASENKVPGYTNFQSANQSNLTPVDVIKIYMKAVEKLTSSMQKAKTDMNLYNQKKNNKNPKIKEESKAIFLGITYNVNDMKEIVEEFIRGMSVVHDLAAQDLMSLLYYRFNFVQENLDLFYITSKASYADDILVILKRLETSFKKMLDILVTYEDKNNDDQARKNAKLDV